MAAVPSPLSIDEYMASTYSPDREYVDGELVERNVGKGKHSFTQTEIATRLREAGRRSGWVALVEQRVRVSATRVRIPDVCLVEKLEEVITVPPLLCVEVRSADDTLSRTYQSISDYLSLEVTHVWIVDPYRRRARVFDGDNVDELHGEGILRASELGIEIPFGDVLPPADD